MRNAACSLAWLALHLSLTLSKLLDANPALHIAAHRAAFSTSAFCKVQLLLRSCGCVVGVAERNAARSSAWLALHLSLILSGLAVLKNRKAFICLYAE